MTMLWLDSMDWGTRMPNRYEEYVFGGGSTTGFSNNPGNQSGGRFTNRFRSQGSTGPQGSVTPGYVRKQMSSAYGSVVCGFAFKVDTQLLHSSGLQAMECFVLYDNTTAQISIGINASRQMYLAFGAGQANTVVAPVGSIGQLATGNWYYVEMKATMSLTAGSVELRVNGVNVASASGLRTINSSNPTWNRFLLGNPSSYAIGNVQQSWTVDVSYDDLYILDQSGSLNNDFLGDQRVYSMAVTGVGTWADFSQAGGTGGQPYTAVATEDTLINEDTTYIASSNVGDRHTFATADIPLNVLAVNGMQLVTVARKDDAGFRHAQGIIRSGSAEVYLGDMNLSTSYQNSSGFPPMIQEVDPATSAPWTPVTANAVQIGVRVLS